MAWLKVDDGMPEHRKVLTLPRKDRWTWMELLCYVARQNNGGHVPAGVTDVLRYVNTAFLTQCENAGLLDRDPGGYVVHDWAVYNASTIEEKVAACLERNPDATANEIHRAVGGKREIVLHEIARQKGFTGSQSVPPVVPDPVPKEPGKRFPGTTKTGSPSRARAHPAPSPEVTSSSSSPKDADDDEAIKEQLEAAGWTDGRIALIADRGHLDLAARWLQASEADPTVENPGAYAFTMTESGKAPPVLRERQTTIAPGAVGTRSTSPPLPDKAPEPDLERIEPPAEFLALAGKRTPEPPLTEDDDA